MGSPYLSADESIILSAHDIVINTVSAEAILTNKRLMLVDRTHPRFLPQDVPFTAVETVTIGENSGGDPVLSLSIVTPDGTRQPLGVTFPRGGKVTRTRERDEWAARLRELSMTSQHEVGAVAAELNPPWVPGPLPDDAAQGDGGEIVPAGTRFKGPSLSERRNRAAGASTMRTIGIAAVILLILAVLAFAAVVFVPTFLNKPEAPTITPATPEPTSVMTMPTPSATTVPAPSPEVTIALPTQVANPIPQTGVWIRVRYEGAFTGTAGAPGRFRDIKGSGDQFYQLPVKNELVSAAITKGDNSGNPLTVSFYQDGEEVKSMTITRPGGTLNLDILLSSGPVTTAPVQVNASANP